MARDLDPRSLAVSVAHRDEDFLVLVKPSGLVTTRTDAGPSLVERARALDPRAPQLHPSSRLDAEVTGLVVFARTRRANEHLLQARRNGAYERVYLGLLPIAPEPAQGTIDLAIAPDPRDRRKRIALEPSARARDARVARTRYRCLHALPGGAAAACFYPETGRTHQLRVHAAQRLSPLLGDRLYGGAPRVTLPDGRVLRAPRTMLHCARVVLPALAGTDALRFSAPVPDDLASLWRDLGGPELDLAWTVD